MLPGRQIRGHSSRLYAGFDLGLALYDLQLYSRDLVESQLTHLTLFSGVIFYVTGLLTSLSPCALGMVPLTMAYLSDDGSSASSSS